MLKTSPQEAFDLLRRGDAVLVDVRGLDEFAAGHAEGAVCVPLSELEEWAGSAPTDRTVIVMCRSGMRSALAAKRLGARGLGDVMDVQGGIQAWRRAGLPSVAKSAPMSLERQVRLTAGALVLGFCLAGYFVARPFFGGAAFIGLMLALTAALDICPMMSVLKRCPGTRVGERTGTMETNYPAYRKQLQGSIGGLRGAIPGTMKGFALLHQESMKAGALDEKQKELIALGIGIAARCDGCIAFHTHEALARGATREEIGETIGVAISMGGGPALMYAAHALEALEQFEDAAGDRRYLIRLTALRSSSASCGRLVETWMLSGVGSSLRGVAGFAPGSESRASLPCWSNLPLVSSSSS